MVSVIPIGILRRYVSGKKEVAVNSDQPVSKALAALGIPSELVGLVLVNGRQESKDYVLKDDDEVKLVPPVGGGVLREEG